MACLQAFIQEIYSHQCFVRKNFRCMDKVQGYPCVNSSRLRRSTLVLGVSLNEKPQIRLIDIKETRETKMNRQRLSEQWWPPGPEPRLKTSWQSKVWHCNRLIQRKSATGKGVDNVKRGWGGGEILLRRYSIKTYSINRRDSTARFRSPMSTQGLESCEFGEDS